MLPSSAPSHPHVLTRATRIARFKPIPTVKRLHRHVFNLIETLPNYEMSKPSNRTRQEASQACKLNLKR